METTPATVTRYPNDAFLDATVQRMARSRGVDRSDQITVRHLISNTSGLTDCFFGKASDGRNAGDDLFQGSFRATTRPGRSNGSSSGRARSGPASCPVSRARSTTPTPTTSSWDASSRP